MRKLNLIFAFAAGLLGGIISRNIPAPAVHAQNAVPVQPPANPAAREVRAQSFVLVDGMNRVAGRFTTTPQGTERHAGNPQERVVLRDSEGREIWSAGGSAIRPLAER